MSELGAAPHYKMTLGTADKIIMDFNNMGSDYVRDHCGDYGLTPYGMEVFLHRNWFMKYRPRAAFLEGL